MRRWLATFLMVALAGCASTVTGCASTPRAERDDYFRHIGFRGRAGEMMTLRWLDGQMPLAVYLPKPPTGMFEDPEGIFDAARRGIVDWAGVAGPAMPEFTFVEAPGDADIRVDWAPESDGSWYVAYCAYNANVVSRTFAVERILVSARWPNGRVAPPETLYAVMLHEMGHALGMGGHSPTETDIMYENVGAPGLTDRDRNTLRRLYSVGNGRAIAGAKRGKR